MSDKQDKLEKQAKLVAGMANKLMASILEENPSFMASHDVHKMFEDFKIVASALNSVMGRSLAVLALNMKIEKLPEEEIALIVKGVQADLEEAMLDELNYISKNIVEKEKKKAPTGH